AVESQAPSGAMATSFTEWVWPVRGLPCGPLASECPTVLSLLAVASQAPSGAMATSFTGRVWPVRVVRCWPLASQSRTVQSLLAVERQGRAEGMGMAFARWGRGRRVQRVFVAVWSAPRVTG